MKPYPIFLVGLENKHCVVIGGGHEAEFKVNGLLQVDAAVTVIFPTLTAGLAELARAGRFMWINRHYAPGDLKGAFLVIAEPQDPATHREIWAEGQRENCLTNVMDDNDHCNFVAGSVVRQGPLTLSISTSGAAPAYAVRLRQRFEKEFGPEHQIFLEWLQALRPGMKATHSSFSNRKKRWYDIVDSDILELIRGEQFEEARARLTAISGVEA